MTLTRDCPAAPRPCDCEQHTYVLPDGRHWRLVRPR